MTHLREEKHVIRWNRVSSILTAVPGLILGPCTAIDFGGYKIVADTAISKCALSKLRFMIDIQFYVKLATLAFAEG